MPGYANNNVIVLGAGMSGLGAGLAGLPVFEAAENPGGICSSYYMRPEGAERYHCAPDDGECYRFEIGGGHWIFGGDPAVHAFLRSVADFRCYARKSSVFLAQKGVLVPYPIQNHLGTLGSELAARCLREMIEAASTHAKIRTLSDWLRASFGETLCELFFFPFHNLYTAGLYEQIAPQDAYKSPVNLDDVIQGTFRSSPAVGYNTTFVYPAEGLNILAAKMAASCEVHYGRRVVEINPADKEVLFADGTRVQYRALISTLPLNRTIQMAGLHLQAKPDPSPSVLVLNIGAVKGPRCPEDHWVYVPGSQAAFHRVGFYSNVDDAFLPKSSRDRGERVSVYVERAYPEGKKPGAAEIMEYGRDVIRELQAWDWLREVDVIDPTWIDVAYTWSWAGSRWRTQALAALEDLDIFPVGRYARWVFQGIADSLRDGLMTGAAMTAMAPVIANPHCAKEASTC
ncbi:MAG TPA: FAD-dependent oxidoreductase [Terriglobia bacterium]|nr:FAD-dependent oxidoreductase [Terriglobia bacterium]